MGHLKNELYRTEVEATVTIAVNWVPKLFNNFAGVSPYLFFSITIFVHVCCTSTNFFWIKS